MVYYGKFVLRNDLKEVMMCSKLKQAVGLTNRDQSKKTYLDSAGLETTRFCVPMSTYLSF